jgi:hypothetical protein
MSKRNKFILWCVLVGVTSFWMWAGVQVWLQGSLFEINNIRNLAVTASLFTVLISILSVGLFVFPSRSASLYFGLIIGTTYSLMFRISNLNLVGIFILMILFIYIEDQVKKEINERIKVNPMMLARKGLTNLVFALFILASFAAYQSPAIESFKNIQSLPSSSEKFIRGIVDKTVASQIETQNEAQKDYITEQVSKETIHKANTFLGPYFQYAPPALAFGLFLILWGISWIFIGLSVLLAMAIFWILRKTNFVKIEERDIKAESILI